METPIFSLTDSQLENVYEPSEDSFLLIDALESDLDLIKSMKPAIGLEIGIGSGVVVTALAMALKCSTYLIGVDINPQACIVTKETCSLNSANVEVIEMDLLSCMYGAEKFDIIIFNPPYVVTETLELFDDKLISKTWAGGHKGRQVMDRLFPQIPKLLSNKGFFYLLIIKENNPNEIIQIFEDFNMTGMIISERKIRGEHLYVLRFCKKHVS